MLKKTRIAIALSSLLLINSANAQPEPLTYYTFTDLATTIENAIAYYWGVNPAAVVPLDATSFQDLELGAVRMRALEMFDSTSSVAVSYAFDSQVTTRAIFDAIGWHSVSRDIVAAGILSSNAVMAARYPNYLMSSTIWGKKGGPFVFGALTLGFQALRFTLQDIAQITLTKKYGWNEQKAKWTAFAVSYATAQVYTAFFLPQAMNKMYGVKDKDELRRRKLLAINVCDPSYLLTMRNQYSQYTTVSGVCGTTSTTTTNSNWTYWNNSYNTCNGTYSTKGTDYAEITALFQQNTDTLTFDPDPRMLTSTDLHVDIGTGPIATYFKNNVTAEKSPDGSLIVNLPATVIGYVSIPKYVIQLNEVADGLNIRALISINGKSGVAIYYSKLAAEAAVPAEPAVWPPYIPL